MRKVDQAKYDAKRQKILEAARACFLRDGFRGASISDICAAAKMSPGHLYHYFDSKEAIVRAIVETGLEGAPAAFDEIAGEKDVVDAFVAAIKQRLGKGRKQRGAFTFELLAESARNPAVAEIVRRRDKVRQTLLSELVSEGQRRGQIDPRLDPRTAASILSTLLESIGGLAMRDPDLDTKRGLATLELLIRRFLAPRRAAK